MPVSAASCTVQWPAQTGNYRRPVLKSACTGANPGTLQHSVRMPESPARSQPGALANEEAIAQNSVGGVEHRQRRSPGVVGFGQTGPDQSLTRFIVLKRQ